jgi:hypothetical protein
VNVQQVVVFDVGVVVELAATLEAMIGAITAQRHRGQSRLRRVTSDVIAKEARGLSGLTPCLVGRLLSF